MVPALSSRVLGVIGVRRTAGWTFSQIFEALILTDDKVIVMRTAEGGYFGWGVGNVISAWYRAGDQEEQLARVSSEELLSLINENDYEIPYSRIKKVELKKFGLGAFITIVTDEKKEKWAARGIPSKKKARFEDFENILLPIFADKLSVSK
jgi:hypothetical protein